MVDRSIMTHALETAHMFVTPQGLRFLGVRSDDSVEFADAPPVEQAAERDPEPEVTVPWRGES